MSRFKNVFFSFCHFLKKNYGFLNSYLVGVISDCWSKDNKLEALWICLHDFKIRYLGWFVLFLTKKVIFDQESSMMYPKMPCKMTDAIFLAKIGPFLTGKGHWGHKNSFFESFPKSFLTFSVQNVLFKNLYLSHFAQVVILTSSPKLALKKVLN